MARFAITVEFDLKPGTGERFHELVLANAAASARDEPGCRRFDVLTPLDPAARDQIALYEIYDDREAFEAHKRTSHYLVFRDAVRDMVLRQTVVEYDPAEHAKA